jgi:hypothetical protein
LGAHFRKANIDFFILHYSKMIIVNVENEAFFKIFSGNSRLPKWDSFLQKPLLLRAGKARPNWYCRRKPN